jgi:hypothetical protein
MFIKEQLYILILKFQEMNIATFIQPIAYKFFKFIIIECRKFRKLLCKEMFLWIPIEGP